MVNILKHMNHNKIAFYSIICGFMFAYLSSVSSFKYGSIVESGSTSISNTLFGNEVYKNVMKSSTSNIISATLAKVSVNVDGKIYYYTDLASAVESLPEGKEYTIKLLRNVKISEEVKITGNKNVIIDGQSKFSLIRGKDSYNAWFTGRLFYVDNQSKLTLKNLTLDLGNEWNFDEESFEIAQISTSLNKFFSAKLGAEATAWVIYNNGELIVDNSTIKNHYSNKYGLIYNNEDASTLLNDTNINHVATNDGGAVAYVYGDNAKLTIDGDTVISNNFVSGNGGLFKVHSNALLTMNSGEIRDNRSINSDGVIAMIYGYTSSFIMNDGIISENIGRMGQDNNFNSMFYLHSGGYFEMNGGIIENNRGSKRGAIDVAKSNAQIKLNAGTIQNNQTLEDYDNYSGVYISYDNKMKIGLKMQINDNIYVTNQLINDGQINGNVTIKRDNNISNLLSGKGEINGSLIIKYNREKENLTVNYKMVKGEIISFDEISQYLITFKYNGGVDDSGLSQKVSAVGIDEIPIVPTPTKPGHTLTWYADQNLTILWEPNPVEESTTVYARWTPNLYTVTWNVNGTITTREFYYDEIIEMPENPMKQGYEFIGWTNYHEGMRMPDKDITLVAQWKKLN